MKISAVAVKGLPEVRHGDDVGALVAASGVALADDDVVAVAHKVVSKAEGRVRLLRDVVVSQEAERLTREQEKEDARHIQVVLDETDTLLRAERGVLICLTRHGFVCANAGVDASNVGAEDALVMLPLDPDASARALRASLRSALGVAPAVVVTDSFGRAWRNGQVEIAIGLAGMLPLDDWRGRADAAGRELAATWIAVADQVAAAADLARSKDSREPVVIVRGLGRYVTVDDGTGIAAMLRPAEEDMFR